jgi:hypothetical protein
MSEELVKCDVCGEEFESEELFWNHTDIDTDNQYLVAEYLTSKQLDTCCEYCFQDILKKLKGVSNE